MTSRRLVAASIFLVGLMINPAYFLGCASIEKERLEFDYGEAEMLSLLDEINEARTWSFESNGDAYTLELSLTQALAGDQKAALLTGGTAWAQTARACGNKSRMFGATASACDILYETLLPLEGSLRVFQDQNGQSMLIEEIPVKGKLAVESPYFENAMAMLWLEGTNTRLDLTGTTTEGLARGRLDARELGEDGLDILSEVKPASAAN